MKRKNKSLNLKISSFIGFFLFFLFFIDSSSALAKLEIQKSVKLTRIGNFLIYQDYEKLKEQNTLPDIEQWNDYQNKWYGFEIKYPNQYEKPTKGKIQNKDSRKEAVYEFRKKPEFINQETDFIGFDLTIYDQSKIENIQQVDEIKNKENPKNYECGNFPIYGVANPNDIQLKVINIDKLNYCFNQNYFFSSTGKKYYYNLIPVAKNQETQSKVDEKKILSDYPEFEKIAKQINLIKIVRPKPKPKAPKPHGAKKVNGKYVCAKKNDKPTVSKKNPKGHMDMQCCLDPDEVPNPWCTY